MDDEEHLKYTPGEYRADTGGRPDVSAEEVVSTRSGDVLLRHTILKSDHFPGCQNMKLTPLVDGAPNYRQVQQQLVYGVGSICQRDC